MLHSKNEYGQELGEEVIHWSGAETPTCDTLEGRVCRVVPLDAEKHIDDLFGAFSETSGRTTWTYMRFGPYTNKDSMLGWLKGVQQLTDPMFFTIEDRETGRGVGLFSWRGIVPEHGIIEIGNIAFSPELQHTPLATEAMYMMMARAFNDWGYRRLAWQCDSLNARSRYAALRLGFSYEGLLRNTGVYKGRNRDTDWFSILDTEWPMVEAALTGWLAPENFDKTGNQIKRLQSFKDESWQIIKD